MQPLSAFRLSRPPRVDRVSRPNNQKTCSILRTAAYRSDGILTDKARGEQHDFSHKRGIEATEISAPP